jgi:Phosphotransferase enzyme family
MAPNHGLFKAILRSDNPTLRKTCMRLNVRPVKLWLKPMGWDALSLWGNDVVRLEPLKGGVANDVWSVRVNGRPAVARLGNRSNADLAWEAKLIQHLDQAGLTVPVPIPSIDGRLFADGLMVMTYMEGGPPETERVARCRAAWARLVEHPTCVVHGNPANPGNIRMTAQHVALIDWDESHVDVPDLDLVLPHNAAALEGEAHDIAAQASAAWEAAVCWGDYYAVKRLGAVRAI